MTVTTLIEKLIAFMQNPKDNRRRFVVLDFIEKEEAEAIQLATGIETESKMRVIELYGMQHSMRLHGGESERKRGQIPVKVEDFCKIPMIVALGTVSIAGKDNTGRQLLQWQATIDGIRYFYTEEVRASELVLKTMYKRKGI
jgi:hypothetical protein